MGIISYSTTDAVARRSRLGSASRLLALSLSLALAGGGTVAPAQAYEAPAENPSANLVDNGGFEDGVAPWFAGDGGNLTITDGDAVSGRYSVRVSDRTGTASGPWQVLDGELETGRTYEVSARIKYTAGPAQKTFFVTSKAGSAFTNIGTGSINRGEWGRVSGTFTVPEGADVANYRVFIETPWTPNPTEDPAEHLMDFLVDDVYLGEEFDDSFGAVAKRPGTSNPLIDHKFGADPYVMEHDGRIYVYMTNDSQEYAPKEDGTVDPNTYAGINTLTIISTDDMVNWVDHGAVKVAGPGGAATWATQSWAPAAAHKTIDGQDKFFLYFANNAAGIGVLESSSPIGPWVDPIGHALIDGSVPGASDGHNWLFDPAVLVDDDGEGYLYFGGGVPGEDSGVADRVNHPRSSRVIKLGDDMTSVEGSAQVIDAPAMFEDSGIHKFAGKYYYSYCSNFVGEGRDSTSPKAGVIAYMVSDSPMGPWTADTYQGEILQNMYQFFGVGGNNHHAIFEFQGRWFIAYHAQTVAKALHGDEPGGYRSTHIDEVFFDEDGSIQPISATYEGVAQLKTFDPYAPTEAETLGWQSGVDTVAIDEPGQVFADLTPGVNLALTDLDDGDWAAISAADFGSEGATGFAVKIAGRTGGELQIRTGTPSMIDAGNLVGSITVPASTGWQRLSTTLAPLTGVQDVFFTFKGADGHLFDVDSWQFTRVVGVDDDDDVDDDVDVTTTVGLTATAGSSAGTATLQASVAAGGSSAVAAVGTVEFFEVHPDGRTSLGHAGVVAGKATLEVKGLAAGTRTVVAVFTPRAGSGHLGSTSAPIAILIRANATVTTTVVAKPHGTRSKVAVTVRSGTAAASGSVALTVDGKHYGTAVLVGGRTTVSLSPKLKAGRHTVVATYQGSAATSAGSSSSRSFKVAKVSSRTTVKVTPKSVTRKKARAKVTISVSVPSAKGVRATGKVTVKVGGKTITRTLRAGKATVRLPRFATSGTKKVKVGYQGSSNVKASTKTVRIKVRR